MGTGTVGASTVGASQIAAVLGRDPWTSRYQVYQRLRGQSIEPTEPMFWGLFLEGPILKGAIYRGVFDGIIDADPDEMAALVGKQRTGRNMRYPHLHATPDLSDDDWVVECKNIDSMMWWRQDNDFAEHHKIQLRCQRYVCAARVGVLVGLVGGNRLQVLVDDADLDTPEMDAEAEAWDEAAAEMLARVEAGNPPDPIGTEVEMLALRANLEPPVKESIEIDGEIYDALCEAAQMRDRLKTDKKEIEAAKISLLQHMGEHKEATWMGRTVATWSGRTLRIRWEDLGRPWSD